MANRITYMVGKTRNGIRECRHLYQAPGISAIHCQSVQFRGTSTYILGSYCLFLLLYYFPQAHSFKAFSSSACCHTSGATINHSHVSAAFLALFLASLFTFRKVSSQSHPVMEFKLIAKCSVTKVNNPA